MKYYCKVFFGCLCKVISCVVVVLIFSLFVAECYYYLELKNIMKLPLLILLLSALSVFASEIPAFPFTVVNGEAKSKVRPDLVEIDIDLLAFDKSSEASLDTINQTMKLVIEVLQKNKIDLKVLEATDYYKKTIRDKVDGKELEILGYEISRDISFRWKQIDKYPDLAAELVKIDGVSRVTSDFTVSNEDEVKLGLISDACEKAKKKAAALASGLGVKLGKPYAIKDSGFRSSWGELFGVAEMFIGSGDPFGGGASPNLNNFFVPQFIYFEVTVDVIYRLGK